MAKGYSKKRTPSKYGSRSSYKKKRVAARPSKKAVSSSSSLKMRTLVASEVAKVLASGLQNEKRKSTVEIKMATKSVLVNGKGSMNNCVRIPVTDVIPAMGGVSDGSDVRRRQANKVMVTGVNVRVSLSHSDETRVMLFVYEPHETVREHLRRYPVETEPSARNGQVPEQFGGELTPFQMLGLVSKHGPLMTKKFGSDVILDSSDGTPFECRVATHAGKPMGGLESGGAVFRKKFGGGGLRRTLGWDQKQDMVGYTQWSTSVVNEFWRLGKTYTYMYEGMTEQVFDRSAEILLYIDCPSMQREEIGEDTPLVGAVVKNVVVDVYFHDM